MVETSTSTHIEQNTPATSLVDSGNTVDDTNFCPFEGPEKLLEIWFEPNAPAPENAGPDDAVTGIKDLGRVGLRTVERAVWEDMLDIVKCKVLSVVYGREMDAYLLRCVCFLGFIHPVAKIPPLLVCFRSISDFVMVWTFVDPPVIFLCV